MRKPEHSIRYRLAIEITLIVMLTELLIAWALPQPDMAGSGLGTVLVNLVLLALVCSPLIAWRVLHHRRLMQHGRGARASVWPAWLVSTAFFLTGSALSLAAAYLLHQEAREEGLQRFEKQTDLLEQAVLDSFEKPLFALRSLVGIHAADNGFNRARFRRYWEARGFQRDYPGVRGFGFIEYVPPGSMERFLAAARRDGAPDFQLKTLDAPANSYVIKLVEPIELNRPAIGLDIGSEPVRREAAETARTTGDATLTGVVTLVQDGKNRPGFLLLLPIYRPGLKPADDASRVANHVGFAYSPIVAEELFRGMSQLTLGFVSLKLHMAARDTQTHTIYAAGPAVTAAGTKPLPASGLVPAYVARRHIEFAGVIFTLETASTPAFEASVETSRAWLVLISGTLLSALIAFTLWLLAAGRARAEARAAQLTGEVEKQANIARRTNDAVIITDLQGLITWANESYTRITGYGLQESLGRKPGDLLQCPQTDPETITRISGHLLRREPCQVEILNRHKDGRLYWLDLDIQPLRDERGQFVGFMAVERDITALRDSQDRERAQLERLNAALRETEALMSTINAHAIVSEAGRDGRITRVNEAFCRISGYSADELLGQDHHIVNSGLHGREFWVGMWQTIASGRPWRGQICNRAKDGSTYWVDSVIAPFLDAEGRIEKYVSIRFDITQARQNEQALAMERQRLKNTLEGTNVGTWELNILTGENYVDRRWAEMLGYTLEELTPITPEKWKSLLHPDDEKAAQEHMADYLRGRIEVFEIERRLLHKKGHWIWVLARGTASSRLPDGRIEWVSGTHMDVTERHRLYEQIEQRSNLLSAILDNMPGGLSAFDADLKLVAKNQLFSNLLDFPEELLARPDVNFEDIIRFNAERGEYGAGDVDKIVRPIVERARRPTPHVFERVRPDGRVLEVRGMPMPGGGFVTIYTDITQRKQSEKEARQSDEMLRQAINTLDEAFVIYDAEDRMLMCNQRYRDTYPKSAPMMKPGYSFEDIIRYGAEHGEYAAAAGGAEKWVAQRMEQHRRADTDVIQELGDGRILRIVERKTSDGYTVGFRIDITDLTRARMAAEAASRSKSQFLANMSHEIRTPMNAILGMLSLLHNTELNTRQLDYVNKTEGAAKSLLGLLNDILDFSKVEAGKMTLESTPFRIDHLMRDLSVILSSNTGSKDVEVLFDLDARLPQQLVGDSLRLKQVLINLGGNAVKFTEAGTVLVRVEVLELQPGRVTLEFSVRDTGIGIAPENVARIFEGFSQAEASTTRRFGGTGLGLAISSRLVNLMGGELGLESELGRGSRFHFRVGLGLGRDTAAAIRPPEQADMRGLRLLVVDDNPMALQVLQSMTQAMGWLAETAGSGEEALALTRQRIEQDRRPFDAILVDWQMGALDGWQTSLQIRQLIPDRATSILLTVTAHGRELLSRRPAGEQALLNGFLVKPITPSMLFDAILEARQARPGEPRPARAGPAAATRRLQDMRVLVVEDNRINQQVAQELLEREGALVTLADNGQLGVQAVAAAQPAFDVVLMDVQMPVMDGYAATRAIRQQLGLRDLPIIAMTANAMEGDRQDAMAAGMNAHVGKPFNLDQLVASMLEHSGRSAAGSVAASGPATAPPAASRPPTGNAEFDLPVALERLGGDTGLLLQILQAFGRELPRQPRELSAQLAQGQVEDARRLLHTLKGTAATVGAMRLSAVAAELELRMRQGSLPASDETQQMLERLQAAVAAVEVGLGAALDCLQPATTANAASDATLDRAALRDDLHELLDLLQNSDLACLDTFAQLHDRHGPALKEQMNALEEAMAGLDFVEASRLCKELLQRNT